MKSVGGGDRVVGVAHHRFTVEADIPVMYVYESYRCSFCTRQGNWEILWQLIEHFFFFFCKQLIELIIAWKVVDFLMDLPAFSGVVLERIGLLRIFNFHQYNKLLVERFVASSFLTLFFQIIFQVRFIT